MLRYFAFFLLAVPLPSAAEQTRHSFIGFPAPLRKDVGALPRITNEKTLSSAAIHKINTDLARLDHIALREIRACHGYWKRKVSVPIQGPRYLSILVEENGYCGGVHPWETRRALHYDLQTGKKFDPISFLPASAEPYQGAPSDFSKPVLWDTLDELYRQQAGDDCKDVISTDPRVGFDLWLTASGIAFAPILPHVVAVCSVTHEIPREQAIALGVSRTLFER